MSRTVADVRDVFGLIGDARVYRTGEGQGGRPRSCRRSDPSTRELAVRAALRRCTMLARRLVRRYSRSTPRATERQLMPGERPLGLLQLHDERRQRRAELVEHLCVVDDRVLLHVRRLLGFLHVASANRGVCKTGIGACPFCGSGDRTAPAVGPSGFVTPPQLVGCT
jgi:hypothetical protein